MIKKIIKILLIVTGSLLSLLAILVLLIGEGVLNGYINRVISKQAGKSLNGEITIGSILGKPFTDFRLKDVNITSGSDTLLHCDEIEINYSLKGLLHKYIDINLIIIRNPDLFLKQETDSTWNFMKIMKKNTAENDTTSGEFSWKINVADFRLDTFNSDIVPLPGNTSLPKHIESDIQLSAFYSSDSANVNLQSLKITASKPDFELKDLSGKFLMKGNMLEWKNTELKLNNSLALTNGRYDLNGTADSEIKIDFKPLAFEDLAAFLPGTKIYGHPVISVSVVGNQDEYNFKVLMNENQQNLNLAGKLKNYKSDPSYSLELFADNIDMSSWTRDEALKSNISGNISIDGKGFDFKNNEFHFQGKSGDLRYAGYSLQSLTFGGFKQKDHLSGSLATGILTGSLDVGFNLNDIFGNLYYEISAGYRHLNLQKMPGFDSLQTDLSGSLQVKGRGTSKDKLNAKIAFRSFESRLSGEKLSDFRIIADYDRGNYDFTADSIGPPLFLLSAEGHGNVNGNNDVEFALQPLDPGTILKKAGLPDFKMSGKITGKITGPVDSLHVLANAALGNIVYDSIGVGNLDSDIDMNILKNNFYGSLSLNSGDIKYKSFNIRSADITSRLDKRSADINLQLNVNDSLQTTFSFVIEGFENPLIRISSLGINYNGMDWNLRNDSASILLNKDNILFNNFSLSSGNSDIDIRGQLAFMGDENITISADSLKIEKLVPANYLPYKISGSLTSRFIIKGTSEKPVINGNIFLERLSFKNYKIDSIRSALNFEKEMLTYFGTLNMSPIEPVTLSLKLPVHISLSDSTYLLKDQAGFSASVRSDSLDLKELFSLLPEKDTQVRGFASVHLDMENKLSDPVITGSLEINNAGFVNTEFGARYDNISLKSKIEKNRLEINEFKASAGKGTLNLSGSVNLNPADSLKRNNFELNMKANDFQAMKSTSAELNFNSDIVLNGSAGNSRVKGKIKVNSSRINVDFFEAIMSQKKDDPNPPLLIKALKDTVTISVPADTSGTKTWFSGTSFYKNMKGEVTLDVPGNTWVTGKDMNLELEGSLRAVKTTADVSLFGDLSVKRGFYKIYGRSFDFNRGKITFTGSSELNPELDFEVIYSFRDIDQQLKQLKLTISGRMRDPKYQFMLDSMLLEEKDAISYIVFGKSVNQLGEGERQKMSGEDIVMGTAVSQLSSALKGMLKKSAGLDVFEITGGENWKSGDVTIGKYITNKLYLSYERTFDFNKQTKTADTEKITLEYRILRNLLLKATNQNVNSGFDLIFKKTWK